VNDSTWAATLSFFVFPLIVLVISLLFKPRKGRKK
jgi:uncharacterized membrane protein YtjA (UPF0391 family)